MASLMHRALLHYSISRKEIKVLQAILVISRPTVYSSDFEMPSPALFLSLLPTNNYFSQLASFTFRLGSEVEQVLI
jgi:hypothetical protein